MSTIDAQIWVGNTESNFRADFDERARGEAVQFDVPSSPIFSPLSVRAKIRSNFNVTARKERKDKKKRKRSTIGPNRYTRCIHDETRWSSRKDPGNNKAGLEFSQPR